MPTVSWGIVVCLNEQENLLLVPVSLLHTWLVSPASCLRCDLCVFCHDELKLLGPSPRIGMRVMPSCSHPARPSGVSDHPCLSAL